MKNSFVTLLVAVVIGAGGFYGGMRYAQNQAPTGSSTHNPTQIQGNAGFDGGRGGRGGGNGGSGGMTTGDVLAKDDKSITLKLRDGGSRIVFYGASTQVRKMVDGSINDLAAGVSIGVFGEANSDGSVTAQMIQLRPRASASSTNPGNGG